MKSHVTAGLLAFFLGGIGVHKFYMGKTGSGLLYLLFCWSGIPAIIAFIEAIIYLSCDDKKFNAEYCHIIVEESKPKAPHRDSSDNSNIL